MLCTVSIIARLALCITGNVKWPRQALYNCLLLSVRSSLLLPGWGSALFSHNYLVSLLNSPRLTSCKIAIFRKLEWTWLLTWRPSNKQVLVFCFDLNTDVLEGATPEWFLLSVITLTGLIFLDNSVHRTNSAEFICLLLVANSRLVI